MQRTLIGLCDLCHDGQEVRLTETGMQVIKQGQTLLHSANLPTDRLWTFPRLAHQKVNDTQALRSAASVIRNDLQAEYIKYWSSTLGSLADETLIRYLIALSLGFLGNLPRLNAKMLRRHRPNSLPTAKGHLDRQRCYVDET